MWITDKEPERDDLDAWDEALVTCADGFEHIAVYYGDGNWNVKGLGWCESGKVIAWRKLPAPFIERK